MRLYCILLAGLLLPTALFAQRKGKLPGKGKYRIVRDVPGNRFPKTGDLIRMTVSTPGIPERTTEERVFWPGLLPGGIPTGMAAMTTGDSAVFEILPLSPTGKKERIICGVRLDAIQSGEERRTMLEKDPVALQSFSDELALIQYFEQEKLTPSRSASGLYYTISRPGSGRQTTIGQSVSMLYTGRRLDGFQFDSNNDSSKGPVSPLTFTLQRGMMIKGFEEALLLLNEGGKGRFYIPSGLGYGPSGSGPRIPPHSILIFDIELPSS